MDTTSEAKGPKGIKFIRDTAAEDDFFGTHSRIGSAIAEAIDSNPGMKIVGLLGAWGSGKSTVIKQVEKHLPEKDQINTTLFFTYDAWLNQSDHPRRSFLDALLRFLLENGLSDEKTWTAKLAELNGEIEETETTTSPVLTPSGALVLISLLCVPIGMQFFGYDALTDLMNKEKAVQGQWAFFSGLALILAPAIICAGIYLYRRPTLNLFTGAFWKCRNWNRNRKGYEKRSVMSLFTNKAIEKQVNRTIREPEPSASQFQTIFRDILSEVARTGKRIVLIIDNLDRLHEAEGIAMWTTIRSFFLGSNQSEENYKNLPVILLPVDDKAIKRLYGDQAQSFMDKTFDLTFRVTAPVQSEWKAYLRTRMIAVFGEDTPEHWIYQAARLFERSRNLSANITPRSINVAINAIATLWLQRRDLPIEFASIAYYTIFGVWEKDSIIDVLRSPNFYLADMDPDWARSLAALHYGVSSEMAFQVLIEDQLRSALTTTTAVDFGALADVKGFGDAFLNLIEGAGSTPMATLPINASLLLTSLENRTAFWLGTAWPLLRRQLVGSTNLDRLDSATLQAVQALIRFGGAPGLRAFVEGMAQRVSDLSATTTLSTEQPKIFIDLVGELVAAAKQNNFNAPTFTINSDANGFLDLCVLAVDTPEMLSTLVTRLRPEDLMVELVRSLETPSGWEKVVARFKVARLRADIVHWGPLIDAARNLIVSYDGHHPPTAAAMYVLGTLSSENSAAMEAVKYLLDGGYLQAKAQDLMNGPEATLASVVALGVIFGPSFPLHGNWAQALLEMPSLPESTERMLSVFKLDNPLTQLLATSYDIPEFVPLSRSLITRRVRSGDLVIDNVGAVLENLDGFLNCVEPAYHRHAIVLMSQAAGFWEKLENMVYGANWIHVVRTLLDADDIADEDRAEAVKIAKERLQWLTEADWDNTMRGQSQALELGLKVRQLTNEPVLSPGTDLDGVLDSVMNEILQEPQRPLIKRWFYASSLLSDSARLTKLKNIRDRFSSVSLEIINQIIDVGGEEFLKDAQFLTDADAATRRVIIPQLGSMENARRLLTHPAVYESWVRSSSTETKRYLQEQLIALYAGADGDSRKVLGDIAKKLKVKINP